MSLESGGAVQAREGCRGSQLREAGRPSTSRHNGGQPASARAGPAGSRSDHRCLAVTRLPQRKAEEYQ